MMTSKPFYKSKTLVFNALVAAVAVGTIFSDPSLVSDPLVLVMATAVVTGGNAALRLETNQPITGSPAAHE